MVKIADIRNARKLLKGVTNVTPCDYSTTYSNITGGNIFLKLENLQKTGSFKVRGAYCKMASLKRKEISVITASNANFARGIAFAASKHKREATVVMPRTTPLEKTLAIRNYGASVILEGNDFDESYMRAVELQKESEALYINAFDDPSVIAGYGTIALEILATLPDVQVIVVPVGSGGLIAGIATAAKAVKKDIKIIGVQAAGSTALKQSIDGKGLREIERTHTFADAVAVKKVGEKTVGIIRKNVDEIVTVEDEEIASVILMLLERSKLMVEGAGALSLTAALYGKISLHGLNTAMVISGGNIDINSLTRIIERGLIKEGRLAHITVNLPDAPGILSVLTGIIGDLGVNILNFEQETGSFAFPARQTAVNLTVEVNGFSQIDNLLKELKSRGYEAKMRSL